MPTSRRPGQAVPPASAFIVIDGRRWRTSDPRIPANLRQELVNELMAARRAVRDASTPQDIQEILRAHKPGDRVAVAFTRRTGPATATVTLAEDPTIEFVIDPNATPEQVKAREAWLSSRR